MALNAPTPADSSIIRGSRAGQQRGRGRRRDQHGSHQGNADCLQRKDDGHGNKQEQQVVEKGRRQAQGFGQHRIKCEDAQFFFVGPGLSVLPARRANRDQPEIAIRYAQNVAKEKVGQINRVTADSRNQGDAQGEHTGEEYPDGRIFLDYPFTDDTHTQGRGYAGH